MTQESTRFFPEFCGQQEGQKRQDFPEATDFDGPVKLDPLVIPDVYRGIVYVFIPESSGGKGERREERNRISGPIVHFQTIWA
jgi:hypothetical protein